MYDSMVCFYWLQYDQLVYAYLSCYDSTQMSLVIVVAGKKWETEMSTVEPGEQEE